MAPQTNPGDSPAAGTRKPQASGSTPKRSERAAVPLLNEPLPQFSTILASHDRRFAMVGGRVVTVGDTVGQRVITAIEPRAVVLREPSGVHIRVALGGRFLGVSRFY